MHIENRSLKQLIGSQDITLSPDTRRLLVSDLESGDPQRIKAWISCFQHRSEIESNLMAKVPSLEQIFSLYRTHEHPGRSNYFSDLLVALDATHQSLSVTKRTLVNHLGA